ncbi:MAG: ferrous iron transport protein B [Bacteroidaceae bacterium]|nr:ferrous iron transport protein B [Bacteroidaceae bacterium]
MTLNELQIGQTARIIRVGGEGSLRQHFLDMGMIPGAEVTLIKYAPMGDPMELRVHGYELTLRVTDAKVIETSLLPPSQCRSDEETVPLQDFSWLETEHPGLGEGGRYHERDEAQAEKEGRKGHSPSQGSGKDITLALAGNQNCGKTTLFNQLTGANQHVGNFPGVTVEHKYGIVKGHPNVKVIDLPGIYSLSPYTSEEIVSRRYILDEHPTALINIADATNIERNMYLTLQLMELGVPMVLAVNMMDELEGNGGHIRINEMEALLGIPVVPISAMKNEGVDELMEHVLHVARYHEGPRRQDFCHPEDHGGAVHRCLHAIMHLTEDHCQRAGLPQRFAACKLVEGDRIVEQTLGLTQNEREMVEHIIVQMEEERGLDRQAAIADMRFQFIESVCQRTVVKPQESREHRRSQHIDRILTGRWTALPAFVAIMGLVFYLTFSTVGVWLQDLMQAGIDWFTEVSDQALTRWKIAPAVHSLIIDGVYSGVGTVLVFLPLICLLFFFLSMLEDTGYMARIAFVMDKILRRLGLSGRSIVPLLIGFGCSVPSVMASRTLPSERDRRMTILLIPFMSCTAKIPIYAFFAAAFFPEKAGMVMASLYIIGIVVGIVVALLLKRTLFRGEPVPFVMELPNYRMPLARNVMRLLWDKARDFLGRAFTVIFLASIVVWLLQTFDFHLQMVEDASQSMLAKVAGMAAPLFKPLGLGNWRIVAALVCGFMAKETVVSTLSALFGSVNLTTLFSPVVIFGLLVFCLLYTPCVAAIATIRRELGGRWALFVVVMQCVIAWLCAYVTILIGNLIGSQVL